jgi:hypothetical protein
MSRCYWLGDRSRAAWQREYDAVVLRLLAYIGKLIGTVVVGPGAVVLGDPGLDPVPAPTTPWQRITYRVAAAAVPVILVLIVLGVAWTALAVIVVALCVLIVVSRLSAGRG